MFSGLKEEKKGGKKDGDQMRITKARLVEIIKEEIENLEEFRLSNVSNVFKPSTRGGYKAAGERGSEGKDALSYRVDDEIAKLSSKGRQIAAVATMDANLHSDEKDAEQDQAIQSLSSRFDTLDDPGEVGDSLLGDEEFVNQMRSKIEDPKFIDTIIAKINQRQHTPGE